MATQFDQDAGSEGEDTLVAEINITPLTDIFLVLLVIFMVTSTVALDAAVADSRGVRVDLPRSAATGPIGKGDPVLTITPDGKLRIDRKEIAAADLRKEIERALRDAGSDRLIIRADRATLFGRAVELMGEARQAGAKSIGVVASPAEP